MKQFQLLVLALFLLSSATAQVQIKPLPKAGYEKRIRDYINQMKVVDTHEHLWNPKEKTKGKPDFMWLMQHYAVDDLRSAGMPSSLFNDLWNDTLMTVQEKWKKIQPYWEGSSNTAYNRAIMIGADQLFGVKSIDSTTIGILSDKIAKAYEDPDQWFNHILKEKCNIEFLVEECRPCMESNRGLFDPLVFREAKQFNDFVFINSLQDVRNLEKWSNTSIKNLDELELALQKVFQEDFDKGMAAVKNTLAYVRTLNFEEVRKEQAKSVFDKLIYTTDRLPFTEVKPLQDYMVFRVFDLANKYKLPVQIHTGFQNGNGNLIENTKPTHLVNVFQKYPDVKFILFHGAYPYGGELSTLAKNFGNVYIDLCWLYIISPSYSERYLNEWLETVPASKIMAFGGDFINVEGVYSHQQFAKQIISNVLIAKVRDGYFSEAEAIKIAQMILHDNAVRILNLK